MSPLLPGEKIKQQKKTGEPIDIISRAIQFIYWMRKAV